MATPGHGQGGGDDDAVGLGGGLRPSGPDARGSELPRDSDVRPVAEDEQRANVRAGDVLGGKYRLIRQLGEGGMGSVWLAHNEPLDVDVAVKVIRGASTPHLRQRLLQEARASAKLGHPAIVRATDFGETSAGDAYIVMELLEGEDLATHIDRRGPMTAVHAIKTVLPVAHALALAHDKDIVHRDLKPDNIFLAEADDGTVQPKLIDFGIAKVDAKANERITHGGPMGSPGYMSPEQARGDDVDLRADIWALAVVLYEATTGRLPFEGKNYNAFIRSIIEDEPEPITIYGRGDEALWSIIKRGLEKDPNARWQSMRTFGRALAQWLMEQGVDQDICGTSLGTTWVRPRQSLADLDGVEPLPPPSTATPKPREQSTVPEPRVPVDTGAGVSARPPPPRARGTGARAFLAVGAGVVAAGTLLFFGLRSGPDPVTTTSAATVTTSTPLPPATAAPTLEAPSPATAHPSPEVAASASAAAPPTASASARPARPGQQQKGPAKPPATSKPADPAPAPTLKRPSF